jgi:uncharacterized glyoxalase superfamily protein PhnB
LSSLTCFVEATGDRRSRCRNTHSRHGGRITAAAIEAAGGRPLSPLAERAWGEQAGWFADPDGNVIAVAQRVPTRDPAAA